MSEDQRLTNPGRDDYFTCPACFHDHIGYGDRTITCPCGVTLKLTVEEQPVAVCEIVSAEDAGED